MSSVPYSRYLIYPVPWYSFLIVAGMVLAIILTCRAADRARLPKDTVIDLALWLLPCGIIGARIYYVLFSWDQFRNDLWSVFRIWEGGIAIYGGIIGGFIALLLYCRIHHYSLLLFCDMIAPGLAVAQSIGRWGNWFNIEAYGYTVTNQAFCFFPLAVQVPDDAYSWHLACFFYESVMDFAIFLFLMIMRYRKLRVKGDVFFFYLFLYSAGRLIIEETRLDSLFLNSSVRISQLLSVLICLFVLVRYLMIAWKSHAVSHLTKRILVPFAALGFLFILLYTVSGSLFSAWSSQKIIMCLSLSAAAMTLCLFSVRFSSLYSEVSHADE